MCNEKLNIFQLILCSLNPQSRNVHICDLPCDEVWFTIKTTERNSPFEVFLRTLFGIFPYNNNKYLEIINRNRTLTLAHDEQRCHLCTYVIVFGRPVWIQLSVHGSFSFGLFIVFCLLFPGHHFPLSTQEAHDKASITGSWCTDRTVMVPVICQPSNMFNICCFFFVRRFAHPLAQDFVHGSTVGDVGFRHHMRPLFLPVDHESVWWPFHILPIAVRLAAAFSLPVGV